METIATEQPSASIRRPLTDGKNFNLRALFAGGAATLALIAAGIIVFGSLAAYVAFNGLPVGGEGGDGSGSVAVEANSAAAAASAPARAAAGLAAAPSAVAATPAASTAVAPAPGTAAAAAAAADGATGTSTTGTTVPGATGTTPTGTTPTDTTATGTTPTAPAATGSSSTSSSSGPVGSAVQGLEDTAAGAGVDLPLSETTQGLTDQVDQTVTGTLDGVGGAIGNPDLGQQVGGTLNDVTGGLLGN